MQKITLKRISLPILLVLFVITLSVLACGLPFDRVPTTATGSPEQPAGTPGAAPTGAAGEGEIFIYMVALEDNGASGAPIGCGDSLIEVQRAGTASSDPTRAALEVLFSEKSQYYGESGLYNALYQSNLSVQSIETGEDGIVTVMLTGQVQLGGTCDSPRFKAQIVQTILTNSLAQWAEVFINGMPIDEVLSQQ